MDKSRSSGTVRDMIAQLTKQGFAASGKPAEDSVSRSKPPPRPPKPGKKGDQDARGGRTEKSFPPVVQRGKSEVIHIREEQRTQRTVRHTQSHVQNDQYDTPPCPVLPKDREDSAAGTQPRPRPDCLTDKNINHDRIIKVTGFDKSVTEEALKLHFENRNKSGGGPVDSVSVIDGTAVVHFKHASDAQNVLNKEQALRGQHLSVDHFMMSKCQVQNTFVLSGLSINTHHEMIKDFLESKLENSSVLHVKDYGMPGMVLVDFAESSCPELIDLQTVCDRNTLDNSSFQAVLYQDLVMTETINITTGCLRFVKKYNILEGIRKLGVHVLIDESHCSVTLKGKTPVMAEARKCFNDILQDDFQINMPGIVSFLDSEEAKGRISRLEDEKNCTIVIDENMYAVLQVFGGNDSGTDTEASGSGGTCKSRNQPVKGAHRKKDKTVMGEFQIGKCLFVMKAGTFESEESECIINVTQSDIKSGDIWKDLSEHSKEEMSKQWQIPLNRTEWKKNGVIVTSVTGLPSRFVLHISQKHFKGDPVKTVIKCLNLANSMRGVTSVVFFSMPDAGKDSPSFLVEAINKFQKSAKFFLTSVRLVLSNMDSMLVAAVQSEVVKLENQRRGGFFSGTFGFGKVKSKTPGRPAIEIISSSPMAMVTAEEATPPQDRQAEEEELLLQKSDVEVYICSHNSDNNSGAFDKLKEFCLLKLTPEEVVDERIRKLTARDIKQLRSEVVEVTVDTGNGRVEMRGFSADINNVTTKLITLLDQVAAPADSSSLRTDNEVTGVTDNDDIFGKYVANELRAITDVRRKGKAKLEIQRILYDAQS